MAKRSAQDIEAAARRLQEIREAEALIVPEIKVRDIEHARSEEVLAFCVKKLTEGSTWNELRRYLGLKPLDKKWREIKEILCSAMMPENNEEALKDYYGKTNYAMIKLDELMEYTEVRMRSSVGEDSEHHFMKLHLENLRFYLEAQQKKFEYFAKLTSMKIEDKKSHGGSIIFQNNYFVPRPGDNVKWVDGRPVIPTEEPAIEMRKAAEIEAKTKK